MQKKNIIYLTQLSILAAILLLMTFTPLGYLRMPTLEITFLAIPVTLGAILMGPLAGMILGLIFGISSFIQCVTAASAFGAILLSIDSLATFVICIIPRVLIGLIGGVLFKFLRKIIKNKNNIVPFIVASISVPLFNTVFFLGGIMAFFTPNEAELLEKLGAVGGNLFAIIVVASLINAAIEIAACGAVSTIVSKAVFKFTKKTTEKSA